MEYKSARCFLKKNIGLETIQHNIMSSKITQWDHSVYILSIVIEATFPYLLLCFTADVLVNCQPELSVRHLLSSGSEVTCFPFATSSSDPCYDPDDTVVYKMGDNSGIFSVVENSTHFCLNANPQRVSAPVVCVSFQHS